MLRRIIRRTDAPLINGNALATQARGNAARPARSRTNNLAIVAGTHDDSRNACVAHVMFWLGFNPSVRPCTIASSCVILPASAAAVFGEYLRRGRQELGESEAQAAGADALAVGGGIGKRAGGSAPGPIPAAAVEEAEAMRGELKELRAQVQALRVRAAISRTDGVDNLGNASLGTIRAPVEDGERCAIDAIVRRMHTGTSAGKQENDASAERHADGGSVTGGRGPLPEVGVSEDAPKKDTVGTTASAIEAFMRYLSLR